MKKYLFGFFTALAVSLIFLSADRTAFSADDVVKITIPCHVTPSYNDLYPKVKDFAKRVEELGKGKVKVDLYDSESLFKVKEIVPALMNGACEIAFHSSLHTTGIWPEIGGLALPFLYRDERDCASRWKVGNPVFELVNQEMDKKYGVRILASGIVKGLVLVTKSKAIEKPEDLNGLKIRTAGKSDAEFIKACGGSPTFLSSSEIYEALNQGVIDGVTTYPGTIAARKLDEVLGFVTEMPAMNMWGYQIYTRTAVFNSWPKAVQDAVLQAAAEYDNGYFDYSQEYYDKTVRPLLEKKMKIVSPAPEQLAKFAEIARTTYPEWSKGVDPAFAENYIRLSQTPAE